MLRHGPVHSDVPGHIPPETITVATLNIAGGGNDSKAVMLEPVLSQLGTPLLQRTEGYKIPSLLFLTELQNGGGKHAEFARRFGGKRRATYWTAHVGLIVHEDMLGHELDVSESQDGRTLQVRFVWGGEPVCVTGIYAPAYTSGRARQRYYEELQVPEHVLHQVILGDFQHVTHVGVDCGNSNASNIGRKQWEQFVNAHELQGFEDAKNRDNADESWPTFQGPAKWHTVGNAVRRLDMVWVTGALDMVDQSWRTHVPWGTLDHAIVTAQLIAPHQRAPPGPSDEIVVPMDLGIIASEEFQELCEEPIGLFNTKATDLRHEFDEFLGRCRVVHDVLLKSRKQRTDAKVTKARSLVQCEAGELDRAAAEASDPSAPAGTPNSASAIKAEWFVRATRSLPERRSG